MHNHLRRTESGTFTGGRALAKVDKRGFIYVELFSIQFSPGEWD
jgi:hypothetical protein